MLSQKSYLITLICCFSAMILFTQCVTDKTPLGNIDQIDPAITGDWYHIRTHSAKGSPSESFHGIRIIEDGSIELLTVETATGKLVLSNSPSPGKFKSAYNGNFTLEVYNMGFYQLGGTYNSTFEVTGSNLYFKDGNEIPILASNYIKSEIGNVITQPVQSDFEMMSGDTVIYNSPTGAIPSAYASYLTLTNNQVQLHIYARSGPHRLRISLNDFTGIGTYVLGTATNNDAEYGIWSGDAGIVYPINQPNAGNVAIENFDIDNQVCTGIFSFEVGYREIIPISGNFNIPVYE